MTLFQGLSLQIIILVHLLSEVLFFTFFLCFPLSFLQFCLSHCFFPNHLPLYINLHRNNQQLMFTDSPNQVSVLPGGSRSPLTTHWVSARVCVCVVDKGGKSLGESSRARWSILCNYQPIEMWFISQGIISISREPARGWERVCVCVCVCREILVNKLSLTPLV